MIALAITLRGREAPIIMYLKKYDDALKIQSRLGAVLVSMEAGVFVGRVPDMQNIVDDYGHTLNVDTSEVTSVFVSDFEREMDAQIEMAKIQQNAQAKVQAPSAIMQPGAMGRQFGRPQ